MAMPEASPIPPAEVVGNAFVEQYYQILHHSPELVHKFYQHSSSLSRPDANDVITTVSNMQAINEKILSLKYEDYKAEIKTADAQGSYGKGVIVLVTGCMTGKDNVRKKFTQSFFLAPQDKGYYVLNDVFRFFLKNEISQLNSVSPASPFPSAKVVGNAFVEQYYHILHHSPQLVDRFYQDSSSLSRPDANGVMTTVTNMQAINEKILSLKYEDYKAEIKTVDTQKSYGEGLLVLVTGCMTGKDNVRKKFTQSFFLAPQDNGFYVLNDVFRFVEENKVSQTNSVPANGISESVQEVSLTTEPDHAQYPAFDLAPENQEDAPKKSYAYTVGPKKSYASIFKPMKANAAPTLASVPTRAVRTTPTNTDQPFFTPSEASAPIGSAASESDSVLEEAEGHSIYVRNLPYDATVEQLGEEFKKFGPIKSDGIQVRSSKGFCFGFVEFESLGSMQNALEASPVTIGERQAVIEEKRTITRGMASKSSRLALNFEALAQMDAARKARLQSAKRGKAMSSKKATLKTASKSPSKASVKSALPQSGASGRENLEVVSRSAPPPTNFSASEFKSELLCQITSFLEKVEDSQVEEFAMAKSAAVAHRLLHNCIETSLLAYANVGKLSSLRVTARELDSDRQKIAAERDEANQKLTQVLKDIEEAKDLAEKAQAELKKEMEKVAKLERQISDVTTSVEQKVLELEEERTLLRADGALWAKDETIRRFPNTAPAFKWLEELMLAEDEVEVESPTEANPSGPFGWD